MMHFEPNESALSKKQLSMLQRAYSHLATESRSSLKLVVERYVFSVETTSAANPLVDVQTCRRVAQVLADATEHWDRLSEQHQAWLKAAVAYFVTSSDNEHDLQSPIGFDDDLELTQAVIQAIGLSMPS